MSHIRNYGRILVIVVESADGPNYNNTQDLNRVTREWVSKNFELDLSAWPEQVRPVMEGSEGRVTFLQRRDDHGRIHRFALVDCGAFDVLYGVSSRRAVNAVGRRSENVATNLLLDLLTPDRDEAKTPPVAPYGKVLAYHLSRLWRSKITAAHVQSTCEEFWIVVCGARGTYDPSVPGSSITGAVFGAMDSEEAKLLVAKSSTHRRVAHEDGRAKYAASKTNLAISIDRRTRQMSYNRAVGERIRLIADEYIAGASWAQLALRHASSLPSHVLRQEPDFPRSGPKGKSRSERNVVRRRAGRPEVPLKFLEDGETPNPDYRPETMADLDDAPSAIAKLFRGPTLPRSVPGLDDPDYIAEHYDGIDPREVYLHFYMDGIYRRLHKDQDASGETFSIYRWTCADLGQFDARGFILTPDQVQAIRERSRDQTSGHVMSGLALSGVFHVAAPSSPLFSGQGPVDAEKGRLVCRTSHNTEKAGYRIYYEPYDSRPHGKGTRIIAWLPAPALHRSVVQAIIETVDGELLRGAHIAALPRRREPHEAATQAQAEVDALDEKYESALDALTEAANRNASARQRGGLQRRADEAEAALIAAEKALRELDAEQSGSEEVVDVDVPLRDLADAMAALSLGTKLPVGLAEQVRRVIRGVVRSAILTLWPERAAVAWTATLELDSGAGALRVPLRGELRNEAVDTWIAGPGGMFWAGTPFAEAWRQLGYRTHPGTATRWRQPIVDRLLELEGADGARLRDRRAADLLVRCPSRRVVQATLAILRDETTESHGALEGEIRTLFFDPVTPRLPSRPTWQRNRTLRRVLDVADDGRPTADRSGRLE